MKAKSLFIFAACCLMALTLTGCSDGRVESAASRLGDDISNTVSRIESALDPDDESSGFPDESQQSSIPDYSSSQGGGVNSGESDIENGTESDTESGFESGGDVSSDVSEVSESTKDM